jgi:hypothetical protein
MPILRSFDKKYFQDIELVQILVFCIVVLEASVVKAGVLSSSKLETGLHRVTKL